MQLLSGDEFDRHSALRRGRCHGEPRRIVPRRFPFDIVRSVRDTLRAIRLRRNRRDWRDRRTSTGDGGRRSALGNEINSFFCVRRVFYSASIFIARVSLLRHRDCAPVVIASPITDRRNHCSAAHAHISRHISTNLTQRRHELPPRAPLRLRGWYRTVVRSG